jgi:hypothetical protein
MKKLFDVLQRWTIELCILFGIMPVLPLFFQRWLGNGEDYRAGYAVWGMLAYSVAIAAPLAWWLLDRWFVQRPWRLRALAVGALLGIFISTGALIGMHFAAFVPFYLALRGTPALVMIGVMCAIIFVDWQDKRQFGENTRTD